MPLSIAYIVLLSPADESCTVAVMRTAPIMIHVLLDLLISIDIPSLLLNLHQIVKQSDDMEPLVYAVIYLARTVIVADREYLDAGTL